MLDLYVRDHLTLPYQSHFYGNTFLWLYILGWKVSSIRYLFSCLFSFRWGNCLRVANLTALHGRLLSCNLVSPFWRWCLAECFELCEIRIVSIGEEYVLAGCMYVHNLSLMLQKNVLLWVNSPCPLSESNVCVLFVSWFCLNAQCSAYIIQTKHLPSSPLEKKKQKWKLHEITFSIIIYLSILITYLLQIL